MIFLSGKNCCGYRGNLYPFAMSKYITYWYKRKRESAAHPQREIEREPFCQDYGPIHSTTRPFRPRWMESIRHIIPTSSPAIHPCCWCKDRWIAIKAELVLLSARECLGASTEKPLTNVWPSYFYKTSRGSDWNWTLTEIINILERHPGFQEKEGAYFNIAYH